MWSTRTNGLTGFCSTSARCPPRRLQVQVWASSSDLARPSRPPPPGPPARPGPGYSGMPRPPGPRPTGPPQEQSDASAPRGERDFAGRAPGGRGYGPGRGGFRSRPGSDRGPPGRGRGRDRGRGYSEEADHGLVINRMIPFETVRVLDRMKEMLGIMPLSEALELAESAKDDVILINENADPPLVRICAMSKYRYEQEKAKKDQSKKQREAQQTLKELKMTPRTDTHDFEVKIRQAQNFLSKGDKVKVMIQFKGREMAGMKDLARGMLDNLIAQVESVGTVETAPYMAGNSMTTTLTPKK